jgi:hypothetical protein
MQLQNIEFCFLEAPVSNRCQAWTQAALQLPRRRASAPSRSETVCRNRGTLRTSLLSGRHGGWPENWFADGGIPGTDCRENRSWANGNFAHSAPCLQIFPAAQCDDFRLVWLETGESSAFATESTPVRRRAKSRCDLPYRFFPCAVLVILHFTRHPSGARKLPVHGACMQRSE